MDLEFTKMHGIGNDYVFVDAFDGKVLDPSSLARRISDRHFGVGSDGLILICPADDSQNDCRMEMYNADGSRGGMCGNGIRGVARYVYTRRITRRREMRVETDAGVKGVRLVVGSDDEVEWVVVEMGKPGLERRDVPMADGGDPGEAAVDLAVECAGHHFQLTAVSMGNPHAVVRVDAPGGSLPPLDELPLTEWGPLFEHHPWFPERTNTEFITLRSKGEIDLRVWERGSGETLACGTGACAAVVASVLNGWCDRRVLVHLRGGDLDIEWQENGSVFMAGPVVEVFRGSYSEGKNPPS